MLDDRSQLIDERMRDRSLLIVDNDKRIVDLLKETFENLGFCVIVAFCGEAAIVKHREGKYPCAILDYSLPDIKGDEVAESLRLELPDMGIILLTGFKSGIAPDKLKLFNYVFEKPANLEALIAAVKQSIRKSILEHERTNAIQPKHYMPRSANAHLS